MITTGVGVVVTFGGVVGITTFGVVVTTTLGVVVATGGRVLPQVSDFGQVGQLVEGHDSHF